MEDENRDDVAFEPSDEEGAAFGSDNKLKSLREELKALKKERQEYLDGWQRSRADYANLQKQIEEVKIRAKTIAEESLFDDLIPVLDSFYFAFNNKETWEAVDQNWRLGVEYIHGQLKGILESRGLSSFVDIGKPFDPNRHEAVAETQTDNPDLDGMIATVLKPGYLYRNSVLRPATVSVYKLKSE